MQRIVSLLDTGRHSVPNKSPTSVSIQTPSIQLHIKEYVPNGSLDYAKKLRLSCKFSTVSVQQTPPINWQLVYGPMVQWSTMVQLHSNAKVLSFLSCDGELEQAWSQIKSTSYIIVAWSVVVEAARTAGGCYVHFNIFYDHINIKFVVIKLQNIWFHSCN